MTLSFTGGGSIRSRSGKPVSYAAIVERLGGSIRCEGAYKNFANGPEAALVVQVAEVEVDRETGQVAVKHFTTAHSTGTIINPLMHQGQIDGGVVTAIGYALMEQLVIEQGKVITTNFGENKIPSIRDIPPLKTVIQEFPVGNGPYGGMSIGEPPVLVAAAAIANAVHDAVGVRIYDLPITAEKVLTALKESSDDGVMARIIGDDWVPSVNRNERKVRNAFRDSQGNSACRPFDSAPLRRMIFPANSDYHL